MITQTAMCVFIIWHVLCVLGCVGGSINDLEGSYYGDNFDNEITQDQQEGEESPCQAAELSRWDKVFIALENSHMRQNMLLESLENCCGGMSTLRTHLDQLVGGTDQRLFPSVEAACRGQMEQATLTMQQSMLELQDEESERERRLNATMLMLLKSMHKDNLRKKEDNNTPDDTNSRLAVLKPFPSVQTESSVMDMASMQRTLVAIATDLQKVQQQLSRMLEHPGTLMKDKGET